MLQRSATCVTSDANPSRRRRALRTCFDGATSPTNGFHSRRRTPAKLANSSAIQPATNRFNLGIFFFFFFLGTFSDLSVSIKVFKMSFNLGVLFFLLGTFSDYCCKKQELKRGDLGCEGSVQKRTSTGPAEQFLFL